MAANQLADARAVLRVAAGQIDELTHRYKMAMISRELDDRTRLLLKNLLENQRSALDYLAFQVTSTWGRPDFATGYPLARSEEDFDRTQRKTLRGVAANNGEVIARFKTYQPFAPGCEWMEGLPGWVNPGKHRLLHRHALAEVGAMHITMTGDAFNQALESGEPLDADTPGMLRWEHNRIPTWVESTSGRPILETLHRVQRGATGVIDDFGQALGW